MLEGGLWDESFGLYPLVGGTPYVSGPYWSWSTGATISFKHINTDAEKVNWMGAQIPFIGWDQLELFPESVFWYLFSRNRSTCGVRPYVRATVNPDADSWVARLIEWWINQDTGYPIKERSGVLRYFLRVNGKLVWADTRAALAAQYPEDKDDIKSLTFIPSSVYDNKILLDADPGYIGNLKALTLIERQRLLEGNWKVRAEAGKVFDRSWFDIVNATPTQGTEVRFWDFAATERKLAGQDPDYTACVKIRHHLGLWYIVDCMAARQGPAEVERMFVNISRQDFQEARANGRQYKVVWELEPGSAAIRDAQRLTREIAGIPSAYRRPSGDKIVRAKALASQSEAGNVKVLAGGWNEDLLHHLHHQPDLGHDDIMDAASGAFNELASLARGATRAKQL